MLWVIAQSGDGTPPSRMDEFLAYTSFHAVAVTVCILMIALASSGGRRWSGTDRERTLRLTRWVSARWRRRALTPDECSEALEGA